MKNNLLKSIFISLILLVGATNAWAATIFNCGIEVNETWYKGTGTINSGNWLGNQTAFNNKDFGVITSLKLGGQYDTWDNSQTDNCSWNASNGITITIKKGNTQKDQFKLSCYHSGRDGNNNIWKTTGTIGQCGDKNAYGRYTHNISQYAAGNDYTIAAKWFSPSGISTTGTAKFTIPGFTTTSTSQPFDNTTVNGNSSETISFGTHYGTALKTNDCAISGTNKTEFSVTSITESGVTVKFAPTSAGSKSAKLTITDAHGKTCTITLSGTAILPTHIVTFGVHSSGNGTLTAEAGSTPISSGASVNEGTEVVFTADPRPGYQIEGWYSNSTCTTSLSNGKNNTYTINSLTADKTVYVKFEEMPATSHNITYTEQGTGWTYGTKPASAEEGETVTFVVTPTAGYRVSVTSTDVTLNTNGNNYTFTMPNKDVEITVDAKPEQYTVSLDNQDATTAGATSVTATYGSAMPSIANNLPTKTGYTFGGYYTATDGGGTQYYKTDGTSAQNWTETSVTKLYAKWTPNTYTITYKDKDNANFSGTHASGYPTTHTYGTETTLKDATKSGYTFDGWFTASDCSGSAVTSLGATAYTADITLYAKWTEIPPTTVYLEPNDNWKKDNARFAVYCWNSSGNIWYDMTKMGCDGGNYYMVEIPVAYKDFKFVRLNPATTENNWNDGTKWNETGNLKVPTDNNVLFTVTNWGDGSWGAYSAPQYAITITNGTGGTVTVQQGANTITSGNKVNLNAVITATLAANDGYSKGTAKIKIGDNAEADLVEGQEYTICGPTTISATWKPDSHTVKFDANGHGTAPKTQTVDHNAKATQPADPTVTGYTFEGWYKEPECTNKWIFNTDVVTTDITLYANWTINSHKVTWNPNGGNWSENTENKEETYNYGVAITSPAQPIRLGYTFAGWSPEVASTMPDKDLTYTAQWTANTNTPYTVKHYKQNLDESYPQEATETENLTGTTDTKVTPDVKSYTGFTAPATQNVTIAADGSLVVTYQYTRNSYQLTWELAGGTITKEGTTAGQVKFETSLTAPTVEKTGYTFAGWNTEVASTMPAAVTTYTAQWTAIKYTVTLDQEGAAEKGDASVRADYNANMPELGKLPTPQIGYTFMGYFDQKDGKGTQYYNAGGTSENTWDKTEDATLYAYFQPAKIINITLDEEVFEPISSGEAYVTATPTIDPRDIEGVAICWRLLYSNGDEVTEHTAILAGDNPAGDNKVKFSIVGLATGTYTIEATLHATACGNGEPISTLTKNFIIASEYTVTVKYTCDNQEIKASTTTPAHATEPSTLEASDIFGYTFKEWEAGDGVEIKTTSPDKRTITYTATYNGTITAKYTKKKLIYFKRPADWGTTIYYYNIGSEDKWKNNIDGVKWGLYTKDITHGGIQMTRIGDSDVYYYDYEATPDNKDDDPGLYIAFADAKQDGREPIGEGDQTKCHVSWPIERTRSFNEGTPMFVAANYIHYRWGANYYNAGYWTNHIGETGYTLKIYDKKDGGRKELYSIPFEAATTDNNIPFKAVVDLEAGKTYGFKFVRANGIWYKNDNDGTMTNSNHTDWPFIWDDKDGSACGITTTAAGEYTFTLNLNNETGNLQISVDYPAAVGDYRILYRDNGAENWSGNTRPQNWCHPSRIIKKKDGANDTISFFINKDKEPQLLYQTIKSINASTGAITWNAAEEFEDVKWNVIEKDGVINFTFTQEKGKDIAVTNIELYKGNYYIRVDAVDGQWGHYKTNADNRMTYSAFSESNANSFGEKFSHYKTQWSPRGTNVKFTIANDYSPCITDTLIRDITKTWEENMDEHGNLKSDGSQDPTADKYSANIRFMWNRNTNKISRAYLSSATNVTKKFLILQGDDKMKNAEGKEIAATEHVPEDATLLDDKQNWIYETTIKVQPGARVKLYACYATPEGQNDIANAQYFRGTNAAFSESSTVQILGGTGETWNTMRVIYDFKTNRLMGAWVPDTEIGDNGLQIDADIMIMREHQDEATCINLTENANSKLTEVKTVYGVMRFNRWILNNRANPKDLDVDHCSTFNGTDRYYDEEKVKEHHPVLPLIEQTSIYERSLYFISFPFDVNLSDVFGFGTYWNEWYIEYYDGLKRATEGFFIDSPPNWKYVTPEMADTFKLRAYQGYILGLDLDYMQYNNTSFWTHNMQEVELFFPSTTTMGEIAKKEVTMPALGPEYECKINRPNSDHRVIDSYWRCIGVPSYANYDGLLYAGENGPAITWKTDRTWTGDYTEFPFLYSWNTTDNTITPRSTREFKFKAMHSYLVQNKSEIHWKAVNVNVPPSPAAIMAREMEETRREYEWRITLTKGEKEQDQTFIRLTNHEQVTTEFDFNQDLSKEFNYGRSDIYTLIGYEKAAANSLPISEQTTVIPLGLSIEYNGDYTLAMPDRVNGIGVTLVDNQTGTRTNLSAGMDYTLTLNKGDYNNRFYIEISPVQQVPTDIEYVTGDSNSQDNVRKVLIDNILYIVRDGQIFDARGARLK